MPVSVTKRALIDLLREEMTGASKKNKDTPAVVTEPPAREPPVEASEEAQPQGVFELPPVEDEQYEPHNGASLSRAAYAIAKLVPPKQIDRFYKRLYDLAQDAISWQAEEDMSMGISEQKLRSKIRQIIREAMDDDEDPIAGMMADFKEDEPDIGPDDPGYEADVRSQQRAGDILRKRADAKVSTPWSDIQLKKKKKFLDDDFEFWEEPGYQPEPVEPPGGYGHPMTLDAVAGEVEGLNTPSAVRQFLEDPRKINLLDKLKFLITMPEQERKKVMIGAAADYITKMEQGKLKQGFDYNDSAMQSVIDHYISDLEEEGVLDPGDADTLRSRTEYVVGLDSFKHYAVEYFDNNFDELLKYAPFRKHLKKYWSKMMRNDPDLRAHVEKRKEADLERVRKKKAARKAAKAKK